MGDIETRDGALGATTLRDTTFHGNDAEKVAADTICHDTPTFCQARTRLYRHGRLAEQGFAVAQISDFLAEEGTTVWLDLRDPDHADLAVLQEEFGLHPLEVEDAVVERERPKIDRYPTHLFMTAYAARLDKATGELATSELAAFILPRALITIRKDDGLDIGKVVDRWDDNPDLAKHGVGYLLHGLLDVRRRRPLRDRAGARRRDREARGRPVLPDDPAGPQVQRRSFELRKSLVLLRRVVLPMREVVNTLMRATCTSSTTTLMPYYQDVYDHVLRATGLDRLAARPGVDDPRDQPHDPGQPDERDHEEGHRWAAIIAVPTFITGYYGMNVPYPGFSDHVGFLVATVIMVGSGCLLYWVFRRNDWL